MAFAVQLPDLPGSKRSMPPRIPLASYRHAGPSGPWPWADLVEDDSIPFLQVPNVRNPDVQSDSWRKYPTQLFPNWDGNRLWRSGIPRVIQKSTGQHCVVYYVDIQKDGEFSEAGQYIVTADRSEEFLSTIKEAQQKENRVKLLFVENLSGPALQILGTMYNIEPFFFSSSLNWIPSRYQEGLENDGDHITITLLFLRAMQNPMTEPNTPTSGTRSKLFAQMLSHSETPTTIDTQAPLTLGSNNKILLIDLLALHMIRRKDGSTIISYHPTQEWKSTSASYLRRRVGHAGKSVYWKGLFQRSEDPTLVLLSILWYALYAWDEALENLYEHICNLETRVLKSEDIQLTPELHIIRASLLHYTSLLESFRKAVVFIQKTPNPALGDKSKSINLMDKECDTLISEIDRLEMFRSMQDKRLENVINLAFSIVNLNDSRLTLRDSAVMKQISYMTMIFFPASFVTSAFGMNLTNLEQGSYATLAHYFEVAIPLTLFTIWVMLAIHKMSSQQQPGSLCSAMKWPVESMQQLYNKRYKKKINSEV